MATTDATETTEATNAYTEGQPAVWTRTDYYGNGWGTPVHIVGTKRVVYRVSTFFGEMAHLYVIVETRDGKRHRVKPHNVITDRAQAMWWHPASAREAFGDEAE